MPSPFNKDGNNILHLAVLSQNVEVANRVLEKIQDKNRIITMMEEKNNVGLKATDRSMKRLMENDTPTFRETEN